MVATTASLNNRASLAVQGRGLPAIFEEEVASIDIQSVHVTHNRQTYALKLTLNTNELTIPKLSAFIGKIELESGGSKLRFTRNDQGETQLKIDYYYCGMPRDGMIYQVSSFKDGKWTQDKYDDRT